MHELVGARCGGILLALPPAPLHSTLLRSAPTPSSACPFNARARQGPRVPPRPSPSSLDFPLSFSFLLRPPLPPPARAGTQLSLYFCAHTSPDPARARAGGGRGESAARARGRAAARPTWGSHRFGLSGRAGRVRAWEGARADGRVAAAAAAARGGGGFTPGLGVGAAAGARAAPRGEWARAGGRAWPRPESRRGAHGDPTRRGAARRDPRPRRGLGSGSRPRPRRPRWPLRVPAGARVPLPPPAECGPPPPSRTPPLPARARHSRELSLRKVQDECRGAKCPAVPSSSLIA